MHTHLPTDQDIADAKSRMEKRKEALGLAEAPPVFKHSATSRKITFLHTWVTRAQLSHITSMEGYDKLAQQNPAKAEQIMQTQVLQECVLWPKDFNMSDQALLESFPAGVLPSLYQAIMKDSGFDPRTGADRIVSIPKEPVELTPEEIAVLKRNHPLASRFDIIGERVFTVSELDLQTGRPKVYATRYYIYTAIDRATFTTASMTKTKNEYNDTILAAGVLYPDPATLNWDQEPGNYDEWVVGAIMALSGFQDDDPSYEAETSEEL